MIKKISLIAATCILLTTTGCGRPKGFAPEPEITGTNVMVYEVGAEYIENSVSYTGELKTSESTSAVSKVSARILKLNVDEGDYVKAGDILAELDSTDLESAYKTAQAGYNSAMASYNSMVNSSTKQAATAASNGLTSAQLAYDQALANYNRQKELYDNDTSLVSARNALSTAETALANTTELYELGAVSKTDYDSAVTNVDNLRASLASLESQNQAAYDSAKTALDNATHALAQAKENVTLTQVSNESNIATVRAALESAQTALSTAKSNLDNTKIRALSSGYISSRNAEVGQMATPGAAMFTIKNTNALIAEIEVTESVISYIHQGTKAVIDVESAGLEDISGEVTLVNPTKNEQSGMYTVQVAVNNDSKKLNIGMFADVSLITESSSAAITLPTEAIMIEGEENYVYVASPDGKTAEKRVVITGIEGDEITEIVTGITIGDRVIISGQDYLSDDNNAINIVTE